MSKLVMTVKQVCSPKHHHGTCTRACHFLASVLPFRTVMLLVAALACQDLAHRGRPS